VKYSKLFSINEVIKKALNAHLGINENTFQFLERWCKRLDQIVYERGKDFSWMQGSDYEQSTQYFVGNVLTNVNLSKHTQRCFKIAPNVIQT
jgi:hypothetical protein